MKKRTVILIFWLNSLWEYHVMHPADRARIRSVIGRLLLAGGILALAALMSWLNG